MFRSTYNDFAEDFSNTRTALWPGVTKFLDSCAPGSKILDIGCGNGKYLSYRADDCEIHGCDTCFPLLKIAKGKHPKATIIHADGTKLPYADNCFDAVISIAVIHHLPLVALRSMFVEELYRVLRPGGKALVTVWATEALKNTWYHIGNNDYIVPWKSKKNMIASITCTQSWKRNLYLVICV